MIDYKELLKKYMALVVDCEGISFLQFAKDNNIRFSAEELNELRKIEREDV